MTRNTIFLCLLSFVLVACDIAPDVVTPKYPASEDGFENADSGQIGSIAQGKLAAEKCAECHGLNGVQASSGAPFIAGLDQEYLVRSMLAYGNGTRNHGPMKKAADGLNPLALADVTAYYASLDTSWEGAVVGERSRAVLRDHQARADAQALRIGCISCHGLVGRYQQGEVVPNLDGMPLEYFIPALNSYFNGERENAIMSLFKGRLTEEDKYNAGAYFAARTPKMSITQAQGSPVRGKLAARGCAGCHGYDGNSLNPHIPNLAGQPQNYLVKTIKDYRDGRRKTPLMQEAVQHLNDVTIDDLAAYYARQQPESQLHKDISSANAFSPLADGGRIAQVCDACHSKANESERPHMPILSGMHVKYLVSAMQDYQEGRRKHVAMSEVVSFLSDTDIEKVAYFYALRTPAARPVNEAMDNESGRLLSRACTTCHGDLGVSEDPAKVPSLAGQQAKYIFNATKAYGQGDRVNATMRDVAVKLNDDDLQQIANYFEQQAFAPALTYLPDDPATLIKERCSRCHGEKGYSTQLGVPRLAGQLESYLILALKEYQAGMRKDPSMTAMANVLNLLEIKAIAAYYAKQ